jgi:hypothetical protein
MSISPQKMAQSRVNVMIAAPRIESDARDPHALYTIRYDASFFHFSQNAVKFGSHAPPPPEFPTLAAFSLADIE